MNKRSNKKRFKKVAPEEFHYCRECNKSIVNNKYGRKWGVCDQYCYAKYVGVNLHEF